MQNSIIALGLMSGTSLDGIDASILESDGEQNIKIIDELYLNYPKKFRNKLESYVQKIDLKNDILKFQKEYEEIQRELTNFHIKISSEIIEKSNKQIELVGFHGQTILHKPNKGYSIQIGDPYLLSQALRRKVIFNFRKNDILNGGQGAPLAPIYHFNLFKSLKLSSPCIFLNIGGISNMTFCNEDNYFAKDIGPGNVLIDEYLKKTKKLNYDKDGYIASMGKVDYNIINSFIEHEIYNMNNKHSFDRKEFDYNFVRGLDFENAVSTLTYFTAKIISNFIDYNFKEKVKIILCGGGRKNLTLINFLKQILDREITDIDNFGINGDYVESQAFAYLAIRSYLKKNISYPNTTKVKKPTSGGELISNF